ncbi:DUF4258 domain-containing protein [Costertonia aggregata]|uniref:DUF4258 domain-containing protein n=1 Tax=Costertonia aggregata TaxID=343403 RepID=A0A7H9AUA2_9FLAO|nr:DUF4258 domain-containing protein [Costertonia aggregata]QLG47071.1 DUF4258 domain-containing protein [Costertonia aggregata]
MAFLKRLGFYLFGLSIGIVFLTMFLKKKSDETGVSFCYLPNCRTLKDIRSKPMSYSPEVSRKLVDKTLDTLDIATILTDGDIDFGNSDTKSVPCKTYKIEGIINKKETIITVRNCPDKALVQGIVF